jgi:cobalt-zinc-cadmium efflux system outer membrane protein
MISRLPGCCFLPVVAVLGVCGLTCLGQSADVPTLPPLVVKEPRPAFTLADAVRRGLEANPELAAFRQQRGIAAAAVVVARTYPFNPVFFGKLEGDNGPADAGITNHLAQEYKLNLELEVCGQGAHRRQAAEAALSRVEWEVAYQEVKLAARVVWAFEDVVYRQEKFRLNEDRIRLNEKAEQQVNRLRQAGQLTPADLLLVRSEVAAARAQRGPSQVALNVAQSELRRALGLADEAVPPVEGELDRHAPAADGPTLLEVALKRRPDLHARAAAVGEAEARVRLEIANRFGNPNLGAIYEVNETSVSFVGGTLTLPIPVLNAHRGLIQMRQAEQARAVADLRQTEMLVRQDVQAALARLDSARTWADNYRTQLLPTLADSLSKMEKLFAQDYKGVDVLRVIEVRRNLLKAREGYLDSLWEVAQAEADLVAAVGDPTVILGPGICEPAASARQEP